MTLPGLTLRALLAGTSLALFVALVAPAPPGRTTWPSVLVVAALVVWTVLSPASPAPTVLLVLALVVALDTGPAAWPLLLVQAALLSAVHVLASLAALLPRRATWEVAVLLPTLRRWALVQVACLPVLVVAGLGVGAAAGPGLEVVAGVLTLLVVTGLAVIARSAE